MASAGSPSSNVSGQAVCGRQPPHGQLDRRGAIGVSQVAVLRRCPDRRAGSARRQPRVVRAGTSSGGQVPQQRPERGRGPGTRRRCSPVSRNRQLHSLPGASETGPACRSRPHRVCSRPRRPLVAGLLTVVLAATRWYWTTLGCDRPTPAWTSSSTPTTGSLCQQIVPNHHLLGRVISIAGVLAWSAIPVGALVGGWVSSPPAASRWSPGSSRLWSP